MPSDRLGKNATAQATTTAKPTPQAQLRQSPRQRKTALPLAFDAYRVAKRGTLLEQACRREYSVHFLLWITGHCWLPIKTDRLMPLLRRLQVH